MAHGSLVIAHELTAYSDVIAATVGVLRPSLRITVVQPSELAETVTALAPGVVLASRALLPIPPQIHTWIELYPGGSNHAVIYRAMDQTLVADIDFAALMSLLDEALPTPGHGLGYT